MTPDHKERCRSQSGRAIEDEIRAFLAERGEV